MTALFEAGAATGAGGELRVSALGIVLVVAGGGLLLVLFKRLRELLASAPLGARRRRLLHRVRPLAEAVVFIGYGFLTLPLVLGGGPSGGAVVLSVMVALSVALTWFAIRDAVAGLFIKASELCLPGDVVEVDGLRGRVRGLGFRVLALETEAGEEAFIPYSRLSRHSIVRIAGSAGIHRHRFFVEPPGGVDESTLTDVIRRAALNNHWALATRAPEVTLTETGLSVAVYALDAGRVASIEADVRRAVEAVRRPAGDAPPKGR